MRREEKRRRGGDEENAEVFAPNGTTDDPYRRYASPSLERDSLPSSIFPGYLSAEPSSLISQNLRSSINQRDSPVDYFRRDVLPLRSGANTLDDGFGLGDLRDPGQSRSAEAGTRVLGYSPLQVPSIVGQKRDRALRISPGLYDIKDDRPNSLRKVGGLQVARGESNILFVDGLPNDCTRREVGHQDLFRPFIGFKEIRVVHKEPRRSGDKSMVLCFVEFDDVNCAVTALEALQGYKFDDRKPQSPVLKIQFAHFPFRLPSDHGDRRLGKSG